MSRGTLYTKIAKDPLVPIVQGLARDQKLISRLNERGLTIDLVKWEDTARDKASGWGPNISDVMLDVDTFVFPMIGTDNFHDFTLDMNLEHFNVWVGNERSDGTALKQISFQTYLETLQEYIDSPVMGPMCLERDVKILTSGQCCILPCQQGAAVSFNVMINNHYASMYDPPVLIVVASPHGTSAQLLMSNRQRIYFNKNGMRASYVAERLKDTRKKAGASTKGDMNQAEEDHNTLYVFQIPLVHYSPTERSESEADVGGGYDLFGGDGCYVTDSDEDGGIDHAQLSIGAEEGPWNGTPARLSIQRDPRFPIRCTIQSYRVTDTDQISDRVLDDIANQIKRLYDSAPVSEKGSLVTETNPARLTEPELPPPKKYKYVPLYDRDLDDGDY